MILFSLFLAAFVLLPRVRAVCYYPNGGIAPNDTPCRDDTPEAACCGQGYACLSNGMCQATGKELQKDGATELVRGACTDRSWRSSRCPLFCINPETDNVGGGIGIAKCEDTSDELYYCINTVTDKVNCTAKQNVLFFQESPTAITTIGVALTTSESSTKSPDLGTTAAPSSAMSTSLFDPSRAPSQPPSAALTHSPTSSPNGQSGGTNDRAVTIGAAVGASVGVLGLGIFGVWLFFFLRRRRRAKEAAYVRNDDRFLPHQRYEAPGGWKPALGESQNPTSPQELPGWHPDERK